MSRAKRFLGNVSLVFISVVFFLGSVEIAVRILELAPTPTFIEGNSLKSIITFDPSLEIIYRPNSEVIIKSPQGEFETKYRINEIGLRSDPISVVKSENRILALGNSFVEGWGARDDERFLTIAEHFLNNSAKPENQVKIIAAGLSGYGAVQSNILAKRLWKTVKPDAVVFFLIGTMVQADTDFLRRASLNNEGIALGLSADAVLSGGKLSSDKNKQEISQVLATLSEYSDLAKYITQRMANKKAIDAITIGDPLSDLLAIYRAQKAEQTRIYEPTFRHIRAIANFANSQGKPFIVVHLPMPQEISDTEWAEGRKAYGLDSKVYNTGEDVLVRKFCQVEKLQCIFASDVLKSSVAMAGKKRNLLYYNYDFHLNPKGNRILGKWLADRLSSLLFQN